MGDPSARTVVDGVLDGALDGALDVDVVLFGDAASVSGCG